MAHFSAQSIWKFPLRRRNVLHCGWQPGAVMWKEMQVCKYGRKFWEILVTPAEIWTCKLEATNAGQVANWRRPKTGSCWATNEVEWVKPMSVAPSGVHYSKGHRLLMIAIEIFWVKCLQRKIPSSWGVRSPDPHRRVGRGTWLQIALLVCLLFGNLS